MFFDCDSKGQPLTAMQMSPCVSVKWPFVFNIWSVPSLLWNCPMSHRSKPTAWKTPPPFGKQWRPVSSTLLPKKKNDPKLLSLQFQANSVWHPSSSLQRRHSLSASSCKSVSNLSLFPYQMFSCSFNTHKLCENLPKRIQGNHEISLLACVCVCCVCWESEATERRSGKSRTSCFCSLGGHLREAH